jgi:hypothetical protein
MRLASEQTELEWPDEIGSRPARAALLFYFADRYAEYTAALFACQRRSQPREN